MEGVSRVFNSIGLTDKEAKVYLYLAKKSPAKAREISRALNIERVQLYRTLKELQKRGMVESTFGYPASFVAVSFGKVLDLLIKAKREEAKSMEAGKDDLMSQLNLYQPEDGEAGSDKFMVLEGRNYIYSKIAQMIQETRRTLAVVTSGVGVLQAYRSGLLDYGFDHPLKDEVHFRFLTSLSTIANHIEVTKELLQKAEKVSLYFESRIGDFGTRLFPRFIIKDSDELLIFLKMDEDDASMPIVFEGTGLWTNNQVLVHAFIAFFEDMWRNSKDIQDAIREKESNAH